MTQRTPKGLAIYATLYVVVLYAPVLLLPVFSLNDSVFVAFPLTRFTPKWYLALAADTDMQMALTNSLTVATGASLASTLLGLMAARILARGIPGRPLFSGLINLPLLIPDIVLGIALLILMTEIAIPLSLVTVILGHLVLCIPFAAGVLMSRFEAFDLSLEEASRDLGENPWMTFWRVTFPLVLPGVIASLLLTFLISFDDFLIAFFLCGTDTTLPVYIWSELRFPAKLPNVLALGSAILVCSTGLIAIAERLRQRGMHGIAAPPLALS